MKASDVIPKDEQDPHLLEKLRQEHAGILAWAMRGCSDWQARGAGRQGLAAPQAVVRATGHYRESEDALGPFLSDMCVIAAGLKVSKPELLGAYRKWATDSNEDPLSGKTFNARVAELPGVTDGKSNGVRIWRGIGIRDARDAQESFSETVPPRAQGRTS